MCFSPPPPPFSSSSPPTLHPSSKSSSNGKRSSNLIGAPAAMAGGAGAGGGSAGAGAAGSGMMVDPNAIVSANGSMSRGARSLAHQQAMAAAAAGGRAGGQGPKFQQQAGGQHLPAVKAAGQYQLGAAGAPVRTVQQVRWLAVLLVQWSVNCVFAAPVVYSCCCCGCCRCRRFWFVLLLRLLPLTCTLFAAGFVVACGGDVIRRTIELMPSLLRAPHWHGISPPYSSRLFSFLLRVPAVRWSSPGRRGSSSQM